MKIINIDATVDAQVDKVKEEIGEFLQAIENQDEENIIEEFYDTIQSMLGVIHILGLSDRLKDGLNKHNEKLKSRGWKLEDL